MDVDAGQSRALLHQQAQFFQQTVEQQTNTLAQAMNANADMMRTLQADRVPNHSGKVEEYENCRFRCCNSCRKSFIFFWIL